MATLFSVKRTVVRQCTRLYKVLSVFLVASSAAGAQTLFDSMRADLVASPGGYVFVSAEMSDTTLITLAKDARAADLTIVLNGFWGNIAATRERIGRINDACCGKNGPPWQVNPLMYERYHVAAVPSFVISVGPGSSPTDFSKVSGEMSVANALKFFGQKSRIPAVRRAASTTYTRAFATQ